MKALFGQHYPTKGELRLDFNGVEVRYNIAHIKSINVNHRLHDVTHFGGQFREYISAGYADIDLSGMLLLEQQFVPLTEKDWTGVSGIVQAAGTTTFLQQQRHKLHEYLGSVPNPFMEFRETHLNDIASAFYAGEAKREEDRIAEAAYDYLD